jgi:hypothetical protein
MPYIEQKDRVKFKKHIKALAELIENKGEMNYVISELVGAWIVRRRLFSYIGISNAISAAHDAEIELNRRILLPYEVGKIMVNEDLDSFKGILEAIEIIRDKTIKQILADKLE